MLHRGLSNQKYPIRIGSWVNQRSWAKKSPKDGPNRHKESDQSTGTGSKIGTQNGTCKHRRKHAVP